MTDWLSIIFFFCVFYCTYKGESEKQRETEKEKGKEEVRAKENMFGF
jgi:hypothetical protein